MKYTLAILTFGLSSININAQKQTFDVVSYAAPKSWQQQQNEGGVQLSISDKKTGAYAIAIITKATESNLSANKNFANDWSRLVKSTVQVKTEPVLEQPSTENGWEIISGAANYTDGANTGVATLITATSGSKTVSVVMITNTQQYQNELQTFIGSLEIKKTTSNTIEEKNTTTTKNQNNSSIIGLWTNYILETTGYTINNVPQYTAGYLRKEYSFYSDGTYLFRNKQWLTKASDITFIYETGTYTVNGNQLVITPNKGKAGFWGKTSSTKEWGSLKISAEYKLEKTTYTFEIIKDPTYGSSIVLKSTAPTQRDGGKFNSANEPYEFRYSFRTSESSIDNPPGWKTGLENKAATAAAKNNESAAIIISPLTGKIWEGTTTEKFSNAGGTSYNTGGFATNQYQFNRDGTYRFVNVTASHYNDTKTLNYETGTYSINGNQLTISPRKGYNEEWSKTGKTSNGNSDVSNRAVNETWGKKLKTSSRKLEQVIYTFSIGKNGERTALILQYGNGHTEREGNGNQTYLNETAAENSVRLPRGMK